MEDRYLSKAKRIDNGEWVEGYLIFSFTGIPYIVQEYDHILEVMQMYEVDISTICQCTGLKDKRGKLIWENDIIKNDKGNLYKAFWQDDHYQFSWVCVKSEKLPIGAKWNFDCFRGYEIEIAGNAFDNPELLE